MRKQSPIWKQVRAVRERRLYLTPMLPFGWLDAPPGVNRLLGLHWLADLFSNQGRPSPDLKDFVVEFFNVFYRTDAPTALAAYSHYAQHSP